MNKQLGHFLDQMLDPKIIYLMSKCFLQKLCDTIGIASVLWVMMIWGPFYKRKFTLIPAWISNYIHHKVWDEITHPFLNFNGATVEV